METRPQTLPIAITRLTGLIHVSTALPRPVREPQPGRRLSIYDRQATLEFAAGT